MSRPKSTKVVRLHAPRAAPSSDQNVLGAVVGFSPEKGLLVDYEGNDRGPLAAQSVVALSSEEAQELVLSGRPVLLTFERGRADRPIVAGIVQPLPTAGRSAESRSGEKIRAVVDGREITLNGSERVELRCGKASVILTRTGKILVRGTYISSRSSGAHRIRGGSVEIN